MPSIAASSALSFLRPSLRLTKRALLLASIALSACSGVPWPSQLVYKVDIQQGAVVTQEMAAQLRPGMTKEQVRFVLGTAPLIDPFHINRWDYTYRFQPGRGPLVERRYTILFDGDRMLSAGGDPLPTEAEFIASRIQVNIQETKASAGANVPSLPASTPPASAALPPGSEGTPSPATPTVSAQMAMPANPAADAPTADTAAPPDTDSPSILDRLKNLFSDSPSAGTKSTAPAIPNGPGS